MALSDPVAVYNAANNLEAQLMQRALVASGIQAFVTEDLSPVGTWIGGLVPEIHKPQVWVERADIERAKPVIDDFEQRTAELQKADVESVVEPSIDVVCEECSSHASFPAAQRGSVQRCPHCGAYVDVGEEELPDGWEESEGEADAEGV